MYLLTWAEEMGVDVDRLLLAAKPLETHHVSSFSNWLELRFTNTGILSLQERRTFNGILNAACRAEAWFINFAHVATRTGQRGVEIGQLIAGQGHTWNHWKRHTGGVGEAPDIPDSVIQSIEAYLRTSALAPNASHTTLRTYLIWRLAMEYGLRIGEILALRVQDCPLHPGDPLEIVRNDERDHADVRGPYAPRPKTRGRSLGTILSQSVFPLLIWSYVNAHRYTLKTRLDGSRRRSPRVPHPFLLVASGGNPLSRATANKAARWISKSVGIPFHWHLARHAFFTRAYSAVVSLDSEAERSARLEDLVYWGGWSNSDSLQIYTNRARRQRAESALAFWQQDRKWTALN